MWSNAGLKYCGLLAQLPIITQQVGTSPPPALSSTRNLGKLLITRRRVNVTANNNRQCWMADNTIFHHWHRHEIGRTFRIHSQINCTLNNKNYDNSYYPVLKAEKLCARNTLSLLHVRRKREQAISPHSWTSNLDVGGERENHVQGGHGSQVGLRMTDNKHLLYWALQAHTGGTAILSYISV